MIKALALFSLSILLFTTPGTVLAKVNLPILVTNSPYANGINDSCGGCNGGLVCSNGTCAPPCVPTHSGNCGDNGCGVSLGMCADGATCSNYNCLESNGASCLGSDQCSSNNCYNSICCDSGYGNCTGSCQSLLSDMNNCGACGQVCPSSATQCVSGVCLGSRALGDTCSANIDCASGYCEYYPSTNSFACDICQQGSLCYNSQGQPYSCGGDFPYCVNDTCSASIQDGALCKTNADCGGNYPYCRWGEVCSATQDGDFCNSNADCPGAYPYCIVEWHSCKATLNGDGALCLSNADCAGGYCVGMSCTTAPGGQTEGEMCINSSDCVSSLYCVNQRCSTTAGGSYDECYSNSDCASGYHCSNNVCTSGVDGQFCYSNSDCVSGYCIVYSCSATPPVVGTWCDDNVTCTGGSLTCVNNQCSSNLGWPGAYCYSDAACGSSAPYCIYNSSYYGRVCSNKGVLGGSCLSNDNCVSGYCTAAPGNIGYCTSGTTGSSCGSNSACINKQCSLYHCI